MPGQGRGWGQSSWLWGCSWAQEAHEARAGTREDFGWAWMSELLLEEALAAVYRWHAGWGRPGQRAGGRRAKLPGLGGRPGRTGHVMAREGLRGRGPPGPSRKLFEGHLGDSSGPAHGSVEMCLGARSGKGVPVQKRAGRTRSTPALMIWGGPWNLEGGQEAPEYQDAPLWRQVAPGEAAPRTLGTGHLWMSSVPSQGISGARLPRERVQGTLCFGDL